MSKISTQTRCLVVAVPAVSRDLADRLMLALEVGGENGEGDGRCTPDGVPSDSAFIRVDNADGTTLLSLSVTNTGTTNPMVLLREQFDTWREENPCPGEEEEEEEEAEEPPPEQEEDSGGCSISANGTSALSPFMRLAAVAVLVRRRDSRHS